MSTEELPALGKSLVKDTRSLIIDDIVRGGGDVSTSFYPGSFTVKGKKKLVVIQFQKCGGRFTVIGKKKLVVIQFQKCGGRFLKQLEVTSLVKHLRVNRKSWKNHN